jgi:hypothetical protein
MMIGIHHISTQVLAILIDARETRRRLERTMPDATAAAISYVIADPHGTQEWGETVATAVAAGFRASGPGTKPLVTQTQWDIPTGVKDSGHKDWKLAKPLTAAQARHYAHDEEDVDQPEGLDGLTGYAQIRAEYRREAGGPPIDQRAKHIASVLAVEVKPLVKYVQGIKAKVPTIDRDSNREQNQDELEQEIWAGLWASRHFIRPTQDSPGSWERAKLAISGAYKNWYSVYASHRQLGVEAVVRAMKAEIKAGKSQQQNARFPGHRVSVTSLDEAYAAWGNGETPEAVGFDLSDLAWFGWEDAVETGSGAWWAMTALPEEIQGIVERKANGSPITRPERMRLSRFLAGGPTKTKPSIPTNKAVLASVIAGTHQGPIRWSKPKR